MFRWRDYSLRKQLLIVFLVLQILTVFLIFFYYSQQQEDFYITQLRENLKNEARAVMSNDKLVFSGSEQSELQDLIKRLGAVTNTRYTVIAFSGEVLADSNFQAEEMDLHDDRPEIRQIAEEEQDFGQSIRFSDTLDQEFLYLALPVEKDGEISGYLRLARPLQAIEAVLTADRRNYLILSLILIAINLGLVSWLSRGLTRPLAQFKRKAQQLSQGNFTSEIKIEERNKEIIALNSSLNKMARDLQEMMKDLAQEISKREAILAGMMDGIIAIDQNDEIIMINPAARKYLHIAEDDVVGRKVTEVIRQHRLLELLNEKLDETDRPKDSNIFELKLKRPEEKILRCSYTILTDGEGSKTGAIISLTDITELRRLEQVRQEFVANVSHELRTPLTSIIGYLETLEVSSELPEEMQEQFMRTIRKEADRLYLLIDDLLRLSKIEGENPPLESGDLVAVLDSVFQRLQEKAEKNQIKLVPEYPDELPPVLMVPEQIEQAVYNLVDNAIKYTPAEGEAVIRSYLISEQNTVKVEVEDTGLGINQKEQARIFERFYRIDKARSREKGGTGIGLSIVKHIIQNHGSRIEVQSQPGQGSVFRFELKLAE